MRRLKIMPHGGAVALWLLDMEKGERKGMTGGCIASQGFFLGKQLNLL